MEITTIAPFLKYFDNVRERTMRVAVLVPPDKIDWTYAPEKFTCGDLLRHIAVTELQAWRIGANDRDLHLISLTKLLEHASQRKGRLVNGNR